MSRKVRRGLLALSVSAFALTALPGLAAAQTVTPWGIAANDVTPDPAIRQGRLPNGMKYAIMRNAVPKGAASVRLHFDFGSLGEADNERGLAHFIEHMVFNGSTNVPEGDMVKILERQGLKFGPDTNAVTSFDITMYMLDLPQADPARLDTAFMLMREAASEASFTAQAVDRERGVILGERRFREDHNYRRLIDSLQFTVPLAPYADRLPIGTAEVLNTAPAERLKALYHRYYRPENATFIFVGDADPAMIEQRVIKSFSSWKGNGPAGAKIDFGKVDFQRAGEFDTFVDPAIPSIVSITSMRPWSDPADSRSERRRDLVRQLAIDIIDRRLERIANAPDSVLLTGGMGEADARNAALGTSLSIVAKDGYWQQALKIGENELRRALRYGVLKSELDTARAERAGTLRTRAEQADARTSPALAQRIATSLTGNDVITAPAWDLDFFNAQAPTVTAAEVSAELRAMWSGSKPLVHVSSKTALTPAQVAAAYGDAAKLAVIAPKDVAASAFAYDRFGPAGKVASATLVEDLGLRQIRFANGVRLNLKKTDFEKGVIATSVRLHGGVLAMPKDSQGLAAMASNVSSLAATRRHSLEELKTITAGKQVSAGLTLGENAFIVSGKTNPNDLGLQMKLAAAYLTDPGYRAEAQQRWATIIPLFAKQVGADPSLMYSTIVPNLLTSGDARFGMQLDQMEKRTLDEWKAAYQPYVNGPIEITLVGDFDEQQAVKAVAESFGALPRRAAALPVPAGATKVAWRAGNQPIVLTHSGDADKAMVGAIWRTDDDNDLRTDIGLGMLDNVLSILLTESVREKLGASYGSSVDSTTYSDFPDLGYFSARSIVSPTKADAVDAAIAEAVASLRAAPIDKDLLDRARNPALEAAKRDLRRNDYWLVALGEAQSKPQRLDRARQRIAILEALTPADLQKLAQTYLTADRFTRLRITSTNTAAAK